MAITYPTSSSTNIVAGAVGYFFLKNVLSTGADLATPDTWHKIGYIGPIKLARAPTLDASKLITAKTNAVNQEIVAQVAYDAGSSTQNSAPLVTLTFSLLESSIEHMNMYDQVRGNYFHVCIPLGQHGAKWVDYFGFYRLDDGGDENYEGDKNTELTVKGQLWTNSVAVTAASSPTDTNVKATAYTIAQYAGQVRVGT